MSIAASMASMSAITDINNAQMAAIRTSQAQQSLIGKSGNLDEIARKEAQLEQQKLQAEIKAKAAQAAKAKADELKKKDTKKKKLDLYA